MEDQQRLPGNLTQEHESADTLRTSWLTREAQELRLVLIIGMANGVAIGAIFLIYIVLAVVFGEDTSFAPHH